jgi:hypothetical protein
MIAGGLRGNRHVQEQLYSLTSLRSGKQTEQNKDIKMFLGAAELAAKS